MATSAPKFNSLDAFNAELLRLQSERNKAVTAADKKKANAAIAAHAKHLEAIARHDDSQVDGERRTETVAALEALAKQQMYSSVTEMLDDVRPLFAPALPPARTRSNSKKPKVYKYLLRNDLTNGVPDFKQGANRLTDEKRDSGRYREADVSEIKAMQKEVTDWEAKHPKS